MLLMAFGIDSPRRTEDEVFRNILFLTHIDPVPKASDEFFENYDDDIMTASGEGKFFVADSVKSSIKEEHLAKIRETFDNLSSFTLHTATDLSRACSLRPCQIPFYKAVFKALLRLPMLALAKELLIFWGTTPDQLNLNNWKVLIVLIWAWQCHFDMELSLKKIFYCYQLKENCNEHSFWWVSARTGRVLLKSPSFKRFWKPHYFFM